MRLHRGILSAAVALLAAPNIAAEAQEPINAYSQLDRAQSLARSVPFQNPPEATISASGLVDLRVREVVQDFNGVQLRHRSYNGGLVGPTIRIRPGATLGVHLHNELPLEAGAAHPSVNLPHGFNDTNLHTHGLHVSPRSPADDVYRVVEPRESYRFEFPLAADHPAGTCWYHAHKHGSTAFQLAGGMAGALVVEGGLDEIPQIRAAEEKILVLQQFVLKDVGGTYEIDHAALYGQALPTHTTINGVATPTIVMRPGEVQRWRVIHAGTAEAIFLYSEGLEFHEIAVDGLATGRKELKASLHLYPGQRSDVLVKAPATKGPQLAYSIIRDPEKSIRGQTTEQTNVLRILVEGDPLPMPLPDDAALLAAAAFKPADVPTDSQVRHKKRHLRFRDSATEFLIDGKPFDPNCPAHRIDLNTAEEWELVSLAGTHPFHIHVNPFAVKPAAAGEPWLWRDTVVLERNKPVVIRMSFKNFAGLTVLHCHNLIHEDMGMMQAVEIVDRSTPAPTGPALAVSASHAAASTGLVVPAGLPLPAVAGAPIAASAPSASTAPPWRATDVRGRSVSSDAFRGKLSLLVLHRGLTCMHCAEQLTTLKKQIGILRAAGVQPVAVSAGLPEAPSDLAQLEQFPFPVLADADLKCFRDYGCLDAQGLPLHGIFLIDEGNNVLLARRTETAVADPTSLVLNVLKSGDKGE
ncbi:MAG: multicopper oxidase domain-containing protein [Planctomycetales bacterium]|nr:multicopper oxidase domain-containing protein [Planctomycetales bacterium]MBN8624284.1 multicopper oxidase domain-containing protein [Planctomycetota bacterium]